MANQYTTQAQRVGTIKGEMLMYAIPKQCLDVACTHFQMDQNMGDTIIYGRWVPTGGSTGAVANNVDPSNTWSVLATDYETAEGITPAANTLTRKDITVQIKSYTILYSYTAKAARIYEDKLPPAMKKMAGQTMGLVSEMIKNGAFRGSTNKMYAGGTSRATVKEPITNNLVSKIVRAFMNNRASMFTEVINNNGQYGHKDIEAAFVFFGHTDLGYDIRQLPDFTPVAEYGKMTTIHALELGAVPGIRFVLTPELQTVTNSGATAAGTGLKSSGTLVDIYPSMVMAEDAAADLALRGEGSMELIDLSVDQADKADPTRERGYIGAKFWQAAFVQNDGWLMVVETGATDLG